MKWANNFLIYLEYLKPVATSGNFFKVFLTQFNKKRNLYIDANNNQKTRKFIFERRFFKLKLIQIRLEDEDESFTKNKS